LLIVAKFYKNYPNYLKYLTILLTTKKQTISKLLPPDSHLLWRPSLINKVSSSELQIVMTAEVVILNQNGVALAADSAVTIVAGDDIKIFNSIHKLFRLSKRHPVGVMIYGTASLLGVPWEIIIKLYRKQLDNTKFDNLFEYGYNFLKYLHTSPYNFFPKENQGKYIYFTSCGICGNIIQNVNNTVQKILTQKSLSENEVKRIVSNEINNSLKIITGYKNITGELSPDFIRKNFIKVINKGINDTFQKPPIYKKDKVKFVQLISLYFTKIFFLQCIRG